MIQVIDKPSFNEEFRICDFSQLLDSDDNVESGTIVMMTKTNVDVTTSMISNVTVTINTKGLRYKLKGGNKGEQFVMYIRVNTINGLKFEEPFSVYIK